VNKEVPPEYLRHLHRRESEDAHQGLSGVTVRAVVVGALLSLGIGLSLPYSNMIIKGGLLAHNFSAPAAIFSFFIFVGFINVGLGLLKRAWELDRAELATVYIMALLATSVPTIGFSENLLPIIAGYRYYASLENRWAETFVPKLPDWLVPTDGEAIRGFYEGHPGGVPWAAWIEPLIYWCVFMLAVYWVSICILVILRKQWMDREKLPYPLVQVPLALIEDDERHALVKAFFRNKVMWLGFAIPFLVGSFNALHAYFPEWPQLSSYAGQGPLSTTFNLLGTTQVIIMLNFGLVGFAYLLSRDVAFGMWLFFLIASVQRSLFQTLGIRSDETLSRFAGQSGPYLAHQAMGAMIVLVLSGVWASREHLRQVVRKALGRDDAIDDRGELLSYRTAVLGLLGGLLVIGMWLWQSGLPLWVVPVFLFAVFVVFVALTRAVVEGGAAVIRTPLTPADFVVSALGTSALGTSGVISLGLTYVWAANLRIFFMPCLANALKIAEQVGERKRPLFWAILAAILLSLVASIWSVLSLSYAYGGVNLHRFWFLGVPTNAGNYIHRMLAYPSDVSTSGWLFTGFGALVMGGLIRARTYFLWWPLHPLGFAICTFHIMSYVWFSVFIAWAAKGVVLRFGGLALYLSSRPFFLGLIMGQIFVTGLWLVIDHFTGMVGNQPIGGSFV
jgi:hypothetical protein